MRLFFLFSLSTLILFSCSSNNFNPDPRFKKAIEDVVNKYETSLTYTYKFNNSTKSGRSKTVDLKILENNTLNSLDEEDLLIAARGIAYTFYKPIEKSITLNMVTVNIIKDKQEYSYPTPIQIIKSFDSLKVQFDEALQLYQDEKFEQLASSIFDSTHTDLQQELLAKLKATKEEYGALTQSPSLFGFASINKSGKNLLIARYKMYGDKKKYAIRLLMELSNTSSRVVELGFLPIN